MGTASFGMGGVEGGVGDGVAMGVTLSLSNEELL